MIIYQFSVVEDYSFTQTNIYQISTKIKNSRVYPNRADVASLAPTLTIRLLLKRGERIPCGCVPDPKTIQYGFYHYLVLIKQDQMISDPALSITERSPLLWDSTKSWAEEYTAINKHFRLSLPVANEIRKYHADTSPLWSVTVYVLIPSDK